MQHATCNNRRKPSVYPVKRRFQSVGLNVTFIVLPCLGKLRRKDQRVHSALVDDHRLLVSSDGVTNRYPIPLVLIVNVVADCSLNIVVPQCLKVLM
jgi:hypothetical protein